MTDSLKFPFENPPEFGTTLEIMPGIHWLRMPLPMALNHINLYLLEDGDGWFVIDTGMKLDDTRRYWEQIFEHSLQGKPIKGIVCTHLHPDHIGQAGWLTEHWQVPLYMTHGEYYAGRTFIAGPSENMSWMIAEFYLHAGMGRDELTAMRERAKGFGRIVEPLPGSFVRLREGQTLNWGGSGWQVFTGEGHSPEHACLFNAERKVMFSGDQIIANITSNVSVMATEPLANPLQLWLDSHERFKGLIPDDTLILPAHGLPFYGVQARLQQLIDHHEDHLDALEEACVQPSSAIELLPVLFKRELDETQINMALGECIAHLHLLLERGKVERLLEQDVYKYRSLDPAAAARAGKVKHHRDDDPLLV